MNWKYIEEKNRGGEIIHKSWEAVGGNILAMIVYGHIYHKTGYVLHCDKLGFDTVILVGDSIDEIQVDAEMKLSTKAQDMIESLRDFV